MNTMPRDPSFIVLCGSFALPACYRSPVEKPRVMATNGMSPDREIIDFLTRSRLVSPGRARFERLPGGVSSDIWLVRAAEVSFCAKRALPQLRVAADWRAPVERNAKEAAWIKAVASFMPGAVPALLAEDAGAGTFAM